ncbi:TetR/AcrR family transcriptional regulator [Leifsonia aquatica]|jgi:AcrR family transcriptional regulator|uniref:TetR/AcrR family transcriptional regulator n=1 Tax=Leifsonia aquatica TaxID=144185 RepID=UPI0028A78A2F|nr:TetR family transcriptional regulator C-terminal domain-containing protein [Leifsonia aquatica]
MSRAPRKPPAERRAEIAEAARELALADGLAAVTLRGVASRAGVTPALVAHYHPAMDELVAATFAAAVSPEVAEVRALVEAQRGPVARVAALLRTLLDGSRDDVTTVWVEAFALGRRNDRLAETVRGQMDAWQSLIQEVVAEGADSGAFTVADPAAVAWQLLGAIDGLNAQGLVRWGAAGDRYPLLAHAAEGMLGLPRGALAAPATSAEV